jgi:hypothetical protein
MKYPFVIIAFLLILISCSTKYEEPKENLNLTGYSKRIIRLKNHGVTISLYLPEELDTTYSNEFYSDDISNKIIFYTVTSHSNRRLHKKNDTTKIDSEYDFNIIDYITEHKMTQNKSDSIYFIGMNKPSNIQPHPGDTSYFQRIHHRLFFMQEDKHGFISGSTDIKGDCVLFMFYNRGARNISFKKQMIIALQTIEITPDSVK